MEEDSSLSIGSALWLDVHEGHLQLLQLRGELVQLDGPWVGEVGAVEVFGERVGVVVDCALGGHQGDARRGEGGDEGEDLHCSGPWYG